MLLGIFRLQFKLSTASLAPTLLFPVFIFKKNCKYSENNVRFSSQWHWKFLNISSVFYNKHTQLLLPTPPVSSMCAQTPVRNLLSYRTVQWNGQFINWAPFLELIQFHVCTPWRVGTYCIHHYNLYMYMWQIFMCQSVTVCVVMINWHLLASSRSWAHSHFFSLSRIVASWDWE